MLSQESGRQYLPLTQCFLGLNETYTNLTSVSFPQRQRTTATMSVPNTDDSQILLSWWAVAFYSFVTKHLTKLVKLSNSSFAGSTAWFETSSKKYKFRAFPFSDFIKCLVL